MKATINGIRYDTDIGTRLLSARSKLERAHPAFWEETLYATPRSTAMFLACSGGRESLHAQHFIGGIWESGRRIIPLTGPEAKAWIDHHGLVVAKMPNGVSLVSI